MKKIIVNADDFGMSPEVNQAIVSCFDKKLISQTSWMANMPYADQAVSLAKEYGFASQVGLHLNLSQGTPLTERIRHTHLCDAKGQFNESIIRNRTKRFFLDQTTAESVKEEIEAQIQCFLQTDIGRKHLDSHQHIHTNPSVFKILLPLLEKYGFESIRLTRNVPSGDIKGLKGFYKKHLNQQILAYNTAHSTRCKIVSFGSMQDFNQETDLICPAEMMIHPVMKNGMVEDAIYPDGGIAEWWSENRENYSLI